MSEAAKKKREWSPATAWIMGIVATLAGSLIIWFAGNIFNPAPPSDAERNAVFSLVSDLRNTPLGFRAVYLNQHDFMKQWLKDDPNDVYWESVSFAESLLPFAYLTGRKGIGGSQMEPRNDVREITIKSKERLDYGNGDVEYMVKTEPDKHTSDQTGSVHMKAVRVYSLQPFLLPTKVSTHLNDLSLPSKIWDALYAFVTHTEVTSFANGQIGESRFLIADSRSAGRACRCAPQGRHAALSVRRV